MSNGQSAEAAVERAAGAGGGMEMLFLADNFLPHAGGSRVYYHNLLKHLVAQFPDRVTVLTKKVAGWEEFDRRESSESLRIVRRFRPLPNWKYHQLPKAVFPFLEASQLVRGRAVDIVLCGDLYPPGVVGLGLKRLFRTPYVSFYHAEEIPQTDRYRYQPLVRNRIYHGAEAVVAACEFARQNLIRIGIPRAKIHKITPGVDYERFTSRQPRPDLVRQFDLQGKRVVLTVARLCPRKGHDVTLRAAARILPEFPDLHYLIVGKGPDEQRLRALTAELGLGAAVTFVGYVPDEQLPDFYNLCDLFVMPNRQEEDGDIEGFGMIFMEASAAAKAVVGGRSGGTADAVQHGVTGFLVNPEDVDELTATLKLLLSNADLRRKLGLAGARRARADFGWQSRAHMLREVSQAIVEKSRHRERQSTAAAH